MQAAVAGNPQVRDAEDHLGDADDQAEHGSVPAGEEVQRRKAVEQQRGSGEKQANVGHQKSPAGAGTDALTFVLWKLNVTIRRLVEARLVMRGPRSHNRVG